MSFAVLVWTFFVVQVHHRIVSRGNNHRYYLIAHWVRLTWQSAAIAIALLIVVSISVIALLHRTSWLLRQRAVHCHRTELPRTTALARFASILRITARATRWVSVYIIATTAIEWLQELTGVGHNQVVGEAITVFVYLYVAIAVLLLCAAIIWLSTRPNPPGSRHVSVLKPILLLFLGLFAVTAMVNWYIGQEATGTTGHCEHVTFLVPGRCTMSKPDSVYFSATMFTTVGFGDIHPNSEKARDLVTVELLVGYATALAAIGRLTGTLPIEGAESSNAVSWRDLFPSVFAFFHSTPEEVHHDTNTQLE